MINLEQLASNEFVIYANTIDNDVQEFGDYFLIGFQSGFTKEWSYVIPFVLVRNTRFLKFEITLVANISIEDPSNGEIYLSPSGNWDYKIWNTDYATLDPAIGTLIDSGQMILNDQTPPEVIFETFASANEDLQSVIFVPATGPDETVVYQSNNEGLQSYVYYTSNGIWNNTSNVPEADQNEWEENV
jgi:hypothetical protein